MVTRRVRNEVVVWITLLLLQEFRVVLVLNVEQNKADRLVHHHKHVQVQGDREDVGTVDLDLNRVFKREAAKPVDLSSVIEAVQRASDIYKHNDAEWSQKVGAWSCDQSAQSEYGRFWQEVDMVRYLYLTSVAVLSYLKNCTNLLETQLRELVDKVGTEDAIELFEDAANLFKDNDDDDDDFDDNDNTQIEPESTENSRLNDIIHIMSQNIEEIHTFSDILMSFNTSTPRQIGDIEDYLDDSINRYLVMSEMLDDNEHSIRRKKSVKYPKHGETNVVSRTSSNIRQAEQSAFKSYSAVLRSKRQEAFSSTRKRVWERASSTTVPIHSVREVRTQTYSNILHNMRGYVADRVRRQTNDINGSNLVFIKNEEYPCRLLTVHGGHFYFKHYDEISVTTQLWIWSDGRLQHYETGLFIDLNADRRSLTLKDTEPEITFTFGKGMFLTNDDRCFITVQNTSDFINLQLECTEIENRFWSLVTFIEAESSVALITCLFIMQNKDSCLAVTYDGSVLSMKPVTEAIVGNQLWYWDYKYIRHSNTHKYLTSGGLESTVVLMGIDGDINQKWRLDDDYLIPADLTDDAVMVMTYDKLFVDSLGSREPELLKIRFVHTNTDDLNLCDYNKQYFVIKHSDYPCKVLCTKESEIKQTTLIRILVPASSFVAGLLTSFLFLICFECKDAVFAGIGVGVLLAATAAFVAEFSDLLRIDVITGYFDAFSETNIDACLWQEFEGTIQSVKNGKKFQIKEPGSLGYQTITLSKNSDQFWLLQNGTIRRQGGGSCDLAIVQGTDLETNDHAFLETSCSTNYEHTQTWAGVKLTNTSDFFEQTSCLYFLRQTGQTSCSVFTITNHSNETALTNDLPSPGKLLSQLWYYNGSDLYNVQSGIKLEASASNIALSVYPISYDGEDIDQVFSSTCSISTYFIKSPSFPCKVLTINTSNSDINFEDYNHNWLMRQLWIKTDDGLENFESGISINGSVLSTIELIPFDDQGNTHLEKVICPFFLQDQKAPCGVLTGSGSEYTVFLGPVTVDLAESQLWYKSGGTIIHLQTGKPLVINRNLELSLETEYQSDIEDQYKADMFWTVFETTGDFVVIDYGRTFKFNTSVLSRFYLRIIDSEKAFNDFGEFYCSSYNRTYFFLKHGTEPCKLLTAAAVNESPSFQVFNEDEVQRQLWYFEYSRLINVYNGYVLKVTGEQERLQLTMSENLYFDELQDIETARIKGHKHKLASSHSNCSIQYTSNSSFVCVENTSGEMMWSFIDYGALSDISQLMCIFYLRSNTTPCEFVTGYEVNQTMKMKIRPLVEELIENQVYYWKDSSIVHKKSGMLLSVEDNRVSLQNENINFFQKWEISGTRMHVKDRINISLTFEYTDGLLQTTNTEQLGSRISNWIQIPLNYDFEMDHTNYPHCTDNTDIQSVFFITSSRHKCLVLTSGALGEEPVFKAFDQDDVEHQLWYFDNKHLRNVKSGLVLMIDADERLHEHGICMWYKYTHSSAQKWYTESSGRIQSIGHRGCILVSAVNDQLTTVKLQCNHIQRWDLNIISYDENAEYLDRITCMFFIKSIKKPCELLTGLDNNDLKLRPISEELAQNQLWFWKGNTLVNFKTNTVLSIVLIDGYLYTYLRKNTEPEELWETSWYYSNSFIKSSKLLNGDTIVLGFNTENGFVGVQYIRSKSTLYQQWVFVSKEQGLADPNQLHCDDTSNLEMYVVRNEYDDCPLLNLNGNDNIGFRHTDQKLEVSSLWIRNDQHICSAKNMKCLSSVTGPDIGTQLQLQPKYATEQSQKWSIHDNMIRSYYASHLVTYTGSRVLLLDGHSRSDRQEWKWFTAKQIETDDKLLRCSRCYNKGEEKAAEIVSYLPGISTLYNLCRSVAYAAKSCPKVALSSLRDGLIDLAIDAVLIVSAGTVSAIAFGIKTAVKFGFKAGMKAFANGIKSMVKGVIRSLRKGFVNFIKTGFRQTLKRQLTKMKLNVKGIISGLRKLPRTLKTITKTSISSFKNFIKKGLKSVTLISAKTKSVWNQGIKKMGFQLKVTLKNMPTSIKRQLSKLGRSVKQRLKSLNNKLAKKAENAIKKADDLKQAKKIRCKRMNAMCSADIGITTADKVRVMRNFQDRPIDLKIPDKLKDDMDEILAFEKYTKGQYATVGLKRENTFIQKESVRIDDLRKANIKALDENGNIIKDNTKKNVQHTEQNLFTKLEQNDNLIKGCSKTKPCDVILYTKLSPCYDRLPKEAATCLRYITNKCREWLETYSARCIVGFSEFYGLDTFDKKWDDYFKSVIRGNDNPSKLELDATVTSLLKDQINKDTILANVKEKFSDALNSLKKKKNNVDYNDLIDNSGTELDAFFNRLSDNIKNSKNIEPMFQNGEKNKIVTAVAKELKVELNKVSKQRNVLNAIEKIAGFDNDAIKFYLV